jgi:hypothetical protein
VKSSSVNTSLEDEGVGETISGSGDGENLERVISMKCDQSMGAVCVCLWGVLCVRKHSGGMVTLVGIFYIHLVGNISFCILARIVCYFKFQTCPTQEVIARLLACFCLFLACLLSFSLLAMDDTTNLLLTQGYNALETPVQLDQVHAFVDSHRLKIDSAECVKRVIAVMVIVARMRQIHEENECRRDWNEIEKVSVYTHAAGFTDSHTTFAVHNYMLQQGQNT